MTVRSLEPYNPIEGNFVVKFKRQVVPYAKGFTFQLRIGDPSGEIMLRYWGPNNRAEVEKLFNSINKDDVVRVRGETTLYNNNVSINVNPPEGELRVLRKDEYNVTDFLPVTEREPKEMFEELTSLISSIKNQDLRSLVSSFIIDDKEFSAKFKRHPAAMYKHHGWLGGLLEHTLHVTKICDFVAGIHKEMDRDLLITGAILHDVGKMSELEVTTNIKASVEGIMIGHLLLTLEMVTKRMEELNTPKDLRIKVKHLLASHHGKLEYGSPKLPAMPEAMCIYLADDLDAKVTEMITHMKMAATEDDYVYVRDFGNVYLK